MVAQKEGFSLIEILVALVIVGLALSAAVQTIGESTRNISAMQHRLYAHWVAINRLEWLRAESGQGETPLEGEEMMAGRKWHWNIQIQPSLENSIRQVRIQVRDVSQKEPSWYVLEGYLGRP